jgi:hypothetical protein
MLDKSKSREARIDTCSPQNTNLKPLSDQNQGEYLVQLLPFPLGLRQMSGYAGRWAAQAR